MAKYRVTSPSGEVFEVTAPDDAPPEAVMDYARKQWSAQSVPQGPTPQQRSDASVGSRFMAGQMDPFVGGAQLVANVLPQPVADAVGGAFGNQPVTADQVNRFVTERDRRIAEARQATGQDGIDWARLTGNVLNPINAVGAIPRAVTVGGRALVGALTGAGGAAVQPVADAETRGYAGPKIAEVGIGAGVGAVAAPVIGKLGDAITTRISNAMQRGDRAANAPALAEQMVRDALAETGQRMDDYPADVLAKIKADVTASLVAGKNLDAAQLARMADFERLGIKPVSGQVTRDASEFSNQYNLARSGQVGEPIRQRLVEQNRQLTEQIGSFGAREASDALTAGQAVSGALSKFDERAGKAVAAKYQAARDAAGMDQGLPLQGLAQDFESVRRKFGDQNIPGAVRSMMDEFGVTGGKQTKLFTPLDAEELIQVINANADPAKKAEFAALGALRNAVKRTVEVAPDGDAFGPARQAASARFKLQEAVPAITAAADGSVPPDTFVQRFVIGNKDSKQVIEMARILRSQSPEALDEARNQVGAHLYRSAFGENLVGDAQPAPERFAKALRDIGDAKLSAFYTPEQIADLKALSRVVAYINKLPAANSANTSNSANRLLDVAQQIPGLSAISPYAGAALRGLSAVSNAASRGREVQAAMSPTVQATAAELPPAAAQLRDLLTAAIAGGSAAGTAGAVAGRPPESRRQ